MKKFLVFAERFLDLVFPFAFAVAFALFCLYDWNRQNDLLTLRMTVIYLSTAAIIGVPFFCCRKVRLLARRLLWQRYQIEVKPRIGLIMFIIFFISFLLDWRFPKSRVNFFPLIALTLSLTGAVGLFTVLNFCLWLRTPAAALVAIAYAGIIIAMVGILGCHIYDKVFPVKSGRGYAYDAETGEAIEVEIVEPK